MPRKRKMSDPNDPMVILSTIALQEQADKAAERQRKANSRDHALKQMKASEIDADTKRQRFQSACDHLLGNHRMGVKPRDPKCGLHKDYLSDKSCRIYCGKCRFEWHPGDKADRIVRRDGSGLVALPNPTKKSWKEINEFFYSFENSADLTSRAFRMERVEPEDIETEEAKFLAVQEEIPAA